MDNYPITPPPELVQQWLTELYSTPIVPGKIWTDPATRAAQWGADQELEACCEYLVRCAQWEPEDVAELRAARRPKPPSLKEVALEDLRSIELLQKEHKMVACTFNIRRALEQLDD